MNDIQMPNWAKHLAVFDLETTGIDEREARIVTAYIGELNASGEVIAGQSWLANPVIDIPETASAVHGITTEFARTNGADASEVVAEIIGKLRDLMAQGVLVTAQNAAYDFTVLHYEAIRHELAPLEPNLVFDPLVIDRKVDRYRKGKRNLSVLCELHGVILADAHEASADAIAAGRVGQSMAVKYSNDLPDSAANLHASQIGWQDEQNKSFASWMQKNVDPDFVLVPGWPIKTY